MTHCTSRREPKCKLNTAPLAGQIEYWAMIDRASLDNPGLQVSFVDESLASMREPREQPPFCATQSPCMSYAVEQTRRFARQYKKLHDNVATDVDEAVERLRTTHFLGADSMIANRQLDAAIKNFML